MCVVSMIGDAFQERWKDFPYNKTITYPNPVSTSTLIVNAPTREEFEALKKEVELMKDLLKRAKIYDEQNNEPNCEMEDKVALLKKMAEFVGVDLSEIFGNKDKQILHD